jgi:D-serine deaminase-like pyridoxal phosphate-dependent protein
VDAGALALSKDLGPSDPARRRGYGPLLLGLSGGAVDPVLQVKSVTQEHGVVGAADVAGGAGPGLASGRSAVDGRLAVSEKVRILANHSCLSAALFDWLVVVRGECVVDRWRIWRGR